MARSRTREKTEKKAPKGTKNLEKARAEPKPTARTVGVRAKRPGAKPGPVVGPGRMNEGAARDATGLADRVSVPHEEVARRAYELWCAAGCPEGRDMDHWLAAERSLILEVKPWAGIAAVDRE